MSAAFVCLAFATDPVTSPYYHPIKWLITLVGMIAATAGAVGIDNMIKRLRNERPHNRVLLVNEILAEHQVAYPTYFVALLTAGDFKPEIYWAKDVVGIVVFSAFVSYSFGVYVTTLDRYNIGRHHTCTGKDCSATLSWWAAFKLWAPNLCLSVALLVAAVYFAFQTT